MPFKINVSHQGKVYKLESESEDLIGKKIGDTVNGEEISENLKSYKIKITGTSDISGVPGFKGLEGSRYHRVLLTYGKGMRDRRKGLRLRKTIKGEEISNKTIQINAKVLKEGEKKFDDLVPKKEKEEKQEKQVDETAS